MFVWNSKGIINSEMQKTLVLFLIHKTCAIEIEITRKNIRNIFLETRVFWTIFNLYTLSMEYSNIFLFLHVSRY